MRKEASSDQKLGFEFNPVELAAGANFERCVGNKGMGSARGEAVWLQL